ncbi:DUF402 domain-containing protein [Bacillus wiedmannii]|uniref:DUF402 domain-containing protein n=1 Tax=Bacillus thuringiensis TaxID=1428 RepID=A0A1C4ELX6_BACTU|nr:MULTISPECIES: DUF402 domain-containing protein [Bacillus]MCC2327959.1 DUF402 domain-containing protein [Bacillus wiedmannii]MED2885939.1 DUF402 domain-containing protein [Bacillus wiedmannii]MED3024435.1 DUF402 domain-containing protein [Bacillus wiedmannii]OTY02927.1 DUF402 domain-containing protein [Bacillus thuringiensis serovar wratislaviensis]OUB61360.1 hypothetical protein BK743_08395 [Bacillus thuringiensis serovar sylvestriensis]
MSCLRTSDIEIIERKIRYDGTTIDHACLLIEAQQDKIILYHEVQYSFTMAANDKKLTIPKGSYTVAYYWGNLPYNLYVWRDQDGGYLGSYFNIVKNTCITDEVVSFEDLILDIMILPSGEFFILDEDELPESLEQFEDGYVEKALHTVKNTIQESLPEIISETATLYKKINIVH